MKTLILAAALLLLSCQCHALGSVVQSHLGGSASGTSACATAITATGNLLSNTTAGNTLVLVVWGSSSTTSVNPFTYTATTSGITWATNGATVPVTWPDAGNSLAHSLSFYWATNTTALSSATSTSVGATISSATSCIVEFALFELSGISASPRVVTAAASHSAVSSTPTTSYNDAGGAGKTGFVIVTFAGEGSTNLAAGAGFLLGPTATTAIVGQSEYAGGMSNVATISFTGTNPYWLAGYVWLQDGVAGTLVSRHRGWVF
jgi:hypothetical protein